MTLSKFFKKQKFNKGQAALEYFIIFAAVALLGFIGLSVYYSGSDGIRANLQDKGGSFYQKAISKTGLNLANQ